MLKFGMGNQNIGIGLSTLNNRPGTKKKISPKIAKIKGNGPLPYLNTKLFSGMF